MTEKTKEYIRRAKEIHGDKYDYSLVTDIQRNSQKVDIICKDHGIFSQAFSAHIHSKHKCPKCANCYKKTTEEALELLENIHQGRYEYPGFEYKRAKQKIKIICKKHGVFEQLFGEHVKGAGCPKCAHNYKIVNTEGFLKKVEDKLGLEPLEKYDYSEVVYNGYDEPIIVKCKIHGPFTTTPHKHLSGYGCKRCVSNSSKKENKWLDELGVEDLIRQYSLRIDGKSYLVDGYSPSRKTVYEFHGDFFHGNTKFFESNKRNPVSKKTFGELLKKTQEKKDVIEKEGYKYVYIWESDFDSECYHYRKVNPEWLRKKQKVDGEIKYRQGYENMLKYAEHEDYSPDNFLSFLKLKHEESIKNGVVPLY